MTRPARDNAFHDEIKVLIDADRIAERVRELADRLEDDLDKLSGPVTLVPVMTGSMLFTSDLIRHLQRPVRIAPVIRPPMTRLSVPPPTTMVSSPLSTVYVSSPAPPTR